MALTLRIRASDGTVAVYAPIVSVVRVIVSREGRVVLDAALVMN